MPFFLMVTGASYVKWYTCASTNSTSPLLVGVWFVKHFSTAYNAKTRKSRTFVLLRPYWFLGVESLLQTVVVILSYCCNVLRVTI